MGSREVSGGGVIELRNASQRDDDDRRDHLLLYIKAECVP